MLFLTGKKIQLDPGPFSNVIVCGIEEYFNLIPNFSFEKTSTVAEVLFQMADNRFHTGYFSVFLLLDVRSSVVLRMELEKSVL